MTKLFWNYKTEEFDKLDIESDEQAILYVPDTDFAKSAFKFYRHHGFDLKDSISKTIKLFIFKGDIK
jgi:hypothetical protein